MARPWIQLFSIRNSANRSRDPRLDLYGRYVFGDFCRGVVESARLSPGRATDVRSTSLRVDSLSSVGTDAQGRVYALSLAGPVYRLVPR